MCSFFEILHNMLCCATFDKYSSGQRGWCWVVTLGRWDVQMNWQGYPKQRFPAWDFTKSLGVDPTLQTYLGESWRSLCFLQSLRRKKQKMNQYSESERHRMAIWKCLVLRPKAAVGEWCRSSRKIWGQLQQLGARLQCDNHRYQWYRRVSDIVPNGTMIPN